MKFIDSIAMKTWGASSISQMSEEKWNVGRSMILAGAQLEGFRKFFVVFLSFYGCLGFFHLLFLPFSIRPLDTKCQFCINDIQIINDPGVSNAGRYFQKLLQQPTGYFASLPLNSHSIRREGSRLAQQSLTQELPLLIMVDNFNHRLHNHSCRPYFVPVNNDGYQPACVILVICVYRRIEFMHSFTSVNALQNLVRILIDRKVRSSANKIAFVQLITVDDRNFSYFMNFRKLNISQRTLI